MPEMREFFIRQKNHPEVCEGEVFLGNCHSEQVFADVAFQTKRMGQQAFDAFMQEIRRSPFGGDMIRPVFIKRAELASRGFIVVNARSNAFIQEHR